MIRLFYLLVITSLAGLTLYNLTLFKWNVKTKVQFSMGRKLDVPVNTRLWSKTPSEHPEEGKVLTEDSSTKNTSQSHTDLQTRIEIINLNSSKKAEVQLKKILAWTPLTAKKPVWGIKPYSFNKCEYDNCIATGNRSELDSADLLLFRVRALKRDLNQKDLRQYVYPVDVVDLPPVHKPKQMWAYINQVRLCSCRRAGGPGEGGGRGAGGWTGDKNIICDYFNVTLYFMLRLYVARLIGY